MKKFFNILSLFIFCLKMIINEHNTLLKFEKGSIKDNLIDLWHYCQEWVEGDL